MDKINSYYSIHRNKCFMIWECLDMERKKAIITGAEYGMGRGIALVLAEKGYDIAFSYFSGLENYKSALETTKKLLHEKGAKC